MVPISASSSSGDIGEGNTDFSSSLFKDESKVLVVLGIFLIRFLATEVKNLSSVMVSLSLFKLMLCIELLFVTLKIDVIPVHTFTDFFLFSRKNDLQYSFLHSLIQMVARLL